MTPREVLVAARARVAKGWIQGTMAEDENGEFCVYNSTEAVRWCALGAIQCDDLYTEAEAEDAFQDAIGGGFVVAFNDAPNRTQAEVLAAFDKAIASIAVAT